MRDEVRDVSDESDKLASRSKMSALAGLVSSVVVGVVFVVFVVVAFLATLVLDLVVGVVVVQDRHAINWLWSSKKSGNCRRRQHSRQTGQHFGLL